MTSTPEGMGEYTYEEEVYIPGEAYEQALNEYKKEKYRLEIKIQKAK